MTTPSSELQSSPWLLVLLGFLLGQSSMFSGGERSESTIETLLATWQSWINTILVPVYGLCTLLYLGLRLYRQVGLKGYFQKSQRLAPVAVDEFEAEPALEEKDEEGHVNLTGAYKLLSNDNFEGFLAVQGVPWALRRAADAARPVHRITHRGKKIRIKIQGIIESETTYQVGGPPVEINIRGRTFVDTVKYLESGDGIRVTKVATKENYNIEVTRRLSQDKRTITMTSRAVFEDGKEPVQSVQIFERIE